MHRWKLAAVMICMLPVFFGRAAWAEDFSTTNVQVLYGANFHDQLFGYNTADEYFFMRDVLHA